MRILLKLSEIETKSRGNQEYKKELLACGQLMGEVIIIPPEHVEKLKRIVIKYNPKLEKIKTNTKIMGVGDLIERVAQPIAKGIDRIFQTNLQGCGGCQQRKEKLNQLFPIGNNTSSMV